MYLLYVFYTFKITQYIGLDNASDGSRSLCNHGHLCTIKKWLAHVE